MKKTMNTLNAVLSPRLSSRIAAITVPTTLVALRIGAGLLFMQHGVQKLFGLLGGMDGAGASASLFSLMGAAGVLEFFGGLLIVLGLFTRPVAFLLATQMIVAYFIAHVPQGNVPILNGGELALLYALVFGFLASAGSGEWSVDNLIARSLRAEPVNEDR
jgi:putative oxidoreductase